MRQTLSVVLCAALVSSSISPVWAALVPVFPRAATAWAPALKASGVSLPTTRAYDPLAAGLSRLKVTPAAFAAASSAQKADWIAQARAAVSPELSAAAQAALERLPDAGPAELAYLHDVYAPNLDAAVRARLEREVASRLKAPLPASDDWNGVLGSDERRAPAAALAAAKRGETMAGLSAGKMARQGLDDEAEAGPDAYSPEMERARAQLRPLMRWIGDFHVAMRAEFPKADFSMRDSDAFFRYVRVMRRDKRQRPDPRDPSRTVDSLPTLPELITSAARYVYRDRVGLAHPEDYQKRQADRQKFDLKLAERLRGLPGDIAVLDVLPRMPIVALPRPFEELQPGYFRTFPELAADQDSFLAKKKAGSKMIRDPRHLPTVEERIEDIKGSISTRDPMLLLGDSAVAKSFMIRSYYDNILNPHRVAAGKKPVPVVSIGVKPSMGSRELVGRYAPRPILEDGKATEYAADFAYLAGALVRAMVLGQALVLEEITNAQPEFLEVINYYLTHGHLIIHQKGGKQLTVYPHPDFRLFATGNWTHFTGRNSQSQAFWSRWRVKVWEEYPIEETGFILSAKYGLEEYLGRQLAIFQAALSTQLRARKIAKQLQGQHALNLRTLERLASRYVDGVARLKKAKGSVTPEDKLAVLGKVVFMVYGSMLEGEADKQALFDVMNQSLILMDGGKKILFSDRAARPQNLGARFSALGVEPKDLEPVVTKFEDREDELVIAEKTLGEFRFPKGPGGELVPGPSARLTLVPEVTQQLFKLLLSWHYREPYLVMGERAAGKTRTAQFAAHLLKMPVIYIAHSQESNLKEIIGGYYPRSDAEGLVKKTGDLPPLVWLDGKEIQAMEYGKGQVPADQVGAWLFEDDVNLSTMHEMRNTVTDDGVQNTPYRQVAAGPNFWSVQAANPPDVVRYQGRKQLSPAHLSRRQVAWQSELDKGVKNANGELEASSAFVETVLDRLLGAPRSKKVVAPAQALAPMFETSLVRPERALSAEERAKVDRALAIMKTVPSWKALAALYESKPIALTAAGLPESTYGAYRSDDVIQLNDAMLSDASPEFVAAILSKELSHYEESFAHREFLSGFHWLEEGEKLELFRSVAGWFELGRPADKDFRGFFEGEDGLARYWLEDARATEAAVIEQIYRPLAEQVGRPLRTVDSLAVWLAEKVAQRVSRMVPGEARMNALFSLHRQLETKLSALQDYYRKNWVEARDEWIRTHLGRPPQAQNEGPPRHDAGPAPPAAPPATAFAKAPKAGPAEKIVDDFLSLFPDLPPEARAALRASYVKRPKADLEALERAVGLKERLGTLATSISQKTGIKVRYSLEPLKTGSGAFPFYYSRESNSIVFYADAVIDMLKRPGGEAELFGVLDHEAGHGMVSRFDREGDPATSFFFESESKRFLLNALEDPRMENWVARLFPGAEPELEALNADLLAGKTSYKGLEDMPHLQYGLGAIYRAKTGKIAPFVTDPKAREALEKTGDAIERIVETLPPGWSFDPVKHEIYAREAAKKIKELIWPHYEPLISEAVKKAEQMAQQAGQGEGESEGQGQGQGGGRPGKGKPSAGSGARTNGDKSKAREAVEKASGALADKLGGAKQRAELGRDGQGGKEKKGHVSKDLGGKEESKSDGDKGEGKGKGQGQEAQDGRKSPTDQGSGHREERGGPEAAQRLLEDIEEGLHEFFDKSLTAFEDRLARIHEAIDRLTGLLANIFYKNAEPELRGHYEDGDEPDMERLIDIVGSRELDLRFWQRLIEPTKRRFKVMLILDLSGSMKGGAAEQGLLDTVALIVNACQRLGIDVSVVGFDDQVYPDLKPFGVTLDNEGMAKLEAKISATGGNSTSDGDALHHGVEEMKKEDAERRIIFLITDGAGNSGRYKVPDLIEDAKEHRIETVGIGVGGGVDHVKNTYAKTAYITASSAEQLPEPIAELLVRHIWAAYDSDVDTQLHIELGAATKAYARAFLPRRPAASSKLVVDPELQPGTLELRSSGSSPANMEAFAQDAGVLHTKTIYVPVQYYAQRFGLQGLDDPWASVSALIGDRRVDTVAVAPDVKRWIDRHGAWPAGASSPIAPAASDAPVEDDFMALSRRLPIPGAAAYAAALRLKSGSKVAVNERLKGLATIDSFARADRRAGGLLKALQAAGMDPVFVRVPGEGGERTHYVVDTDGSPRSAAALAAIAGRDDVVRLEVEPGFAAAVRAAAGAAPPIPPSARPSDLPVDEDFTALARSASR